DRGTQRASAAGRERRPAAAGVAVVGKRAVHAGVRPGGGDHGRADGQRVRDHRQRRRAGAAVGGGGGLPPHPANRDRGPRPPRPRRGVTPAVTARELISILQQVPWLDATLAAQPWGEIPGYSVAAKTGTAQVWDSKGKCLCQYGSSYIGMAPATHPQVVVAVNLQRPRSANYFGNYVAGPVFYHVMKFALQTLKIPPDGGKRPNVPLTAP